MGVVCGVLWVLLFSLSIRTELAHKVAFYEQMAAGGEVTWVRGMLAADPVLVGATLETPDQPTEQMGRTGSDPHRIELSDGRVLSLTLSRVPLRRRAAGNALLACGCLVFGFALTASGWARGDPRGEQRQALEALVRMRTGEVRAALRDARNADLAKSRFLATMSHELRTPLNAVMGLAEVLSARLADSEEGELAGVIRESAEGLLALINNVLDFSKGAAGRLQLASEPVEPKKLLTSVAAMLRPLAEAKGIHVDHHVDDDVPDSILGDSLHLRQLFTNLGANAVKFTDVGLVAMWIGTTSDRPPRLELGVRDTGPGIPESAQARIFDPFIQLEDRGGIGTGLGLAICRQIVDAMGGTIALESAPGEGTTFRISLPLIRAGERAAPQGWERLRAPQRRHDVLVVEDNPVNRMVITEMLRDTGHEVWTAGTGLEALEILRNKSPDLVLMDCQMPQMDGYEATRRIRAGEVGERAAQLRIVALTAHALPSDRDRCMEAGMDDYLTKPVTRAVLLRALSRADRKEPHSLNLRTLDDYMGEIGVEPYVLFLKTLDERLDELGTALDESECGDLRRMAHSLKGSSAQLGLERLAKVAAELEVAALAEAPEASQIAVLRVEADRARDALKSRLPG